MSDPTKDRQGRIPTDIASYGDLPPLKDSARKLLQEYSKIPDQEIDDHVERIRQRAFKIFPYPCIGMARFLDLSILSQTVYNEVLERVKKGDKFLDLGCCFGQEIRQLVLDGAPAQNLMGSDLKSEFFEMGYDLFKDKDVLPSKFIAADVFDADSALHKLNDQFDIVYTGSFFHLFTYDEQVKVAQLVNDLLVSKPGSMLVGRQVGRADPGAETIHMSGGKEMAPFRHNAESWKKFWRDFGIQTGTNWTVDVEVEEGWNGFAGVQSDTAMQAWSASMRMTFVVRRS